MCLIVLADIKDLEKDNYILIKPNLPGSQSRLWYSRKTIMPHWRKLGWYACKEQPTLNLSVFSRYRYQEPFFQVWLSLL